MIKHFLYELDREISALCQPEPGAAGSHVCRITSVSVGSSVHHPVGSRRARCRLSRQMGIHLQALLVLVVVMTLGFDWFWELSSHWAPYYRDGQPTDGLETVVERIMFIESNGDPNMRHNRTSATGLGQFLDETWLDMIRAYRPDVLGGRSQAEVLGLRNDPNLARDITARFAEQNIVMLRRRGLPVTAGAVYLAHFAGGAGAAAILSAPEDADAASVMARADATGRTRREKLITANPFLEHFTVADLKRWANRKMRDPEERAPRLPVR
jgi:hypothetical protein